MKLELPGIGANVQEHIYTGVTYGMSLILRRFGIDYTSLCPVEVKNNTVDGCDVNTVDPMFIPEEAVKQLALQYVHLQIIH